MKSIITLSLCFTAFLLATCTPKLSQKIPTSTTPDFGKNVLIHQGSTGFGPCEPSIYINPKDDNKIVAGAVLDNVYFSEDGGATWSKNKLKSSYGVYGDPVIGGDSKGNFYYLHLSDPDKKGWASPKLLDRIVIQKSTDGKTWEDGSFMGMHHPKDQDKHWIGIDPKTNALYVTWTEFDKYNSKKEGDNSRILFSKSTDEGETWSETVSINQFSGNCLDDDRTTEGAVPVAGLNGEVYVAWSYDDKIFFDYSTDGGTSWQDTDIVAAQQPNGWTFDIPDIGRANGLPILSIDHSQSKHRGTLYLNWTDQRNGENDTDVWLSKSTDKGLTWSKPKRVNDDAAGKQQFFTWMSVDEATGYIYTVFYDRRNHDDSQTDVYLAYSKDGGETFTNQKISETPFLPTSEGVFFGDYNNISARNGKVRPIWTRCDGGKLSVWTSLIDF
ncbi:MAG: hypothetical protein ACI85O_001257 [Saprospiraceae bacterium]|jgi:hypothetical protein